jgi:hypothetical protein
MNSPVVSPGASQDAVLAQIDAGQKRAFALGFAGLVALIIAGFIMRGSGATAWLPFLHDYLIAFVFWTAVAVGALGVLMIHHSTGGWWGYPLRRIFEACARTLPLIVLFFLVPLFTMSRIYSSWVHPDTGDSVLMAKMWYLNVHGFVIRAVVYFAIWFFLAFRLTRLSAREDATGDPTISHSMEVISAPGLVLGAGAITVAAVDWVMSLQPDWFSTIFGFLFIVIFLLAGYSFSVYTFSRLAENEPLRDALDPSRYLDMGNLILVFTLLWAYMSFSQFLIIWAGNLKPEIPFYMARAFGGWGVVGGLLLLLHFFVAFFLLLMRTIKRRLPRLAKVALLQFVLTLMDLYWLIVPSYQKGPRFADLGILFAVVGLGGIWVAVFLGQLKRLPLLPLHDPRFPGRSPAIPPTHDFLHHQGPHPREVET